MRAITVVAVAVAQAALLAGCQAGAVIAPNAEPSLRVAAPSPTASVTIVVNPIAPRASPGSPAPQASTSPVASASPLATAGPSPIPTPLPPGTSPSPAPAPTPTGPKLYVVNHSTFGAGAASAPSVTVYPLGASGDATPIARLAGSATRESQIYYPAVDSYGTLYLGNQNGSTTSGTVSEFSGVLGNVAPTRTLGGFYQPLGVALDATNALYVGEAGALDVFRAGAEPGTAPNRRIAGSNTTLAGQSIYQVFVERTGKQDIALQNAVITFPYGASGNVAPTQNIYGATTGIVYALGVAADAHGNLYVTNFTLNDILEFGPTATGNTAPSSTVVGSAFNQPWGIFFDANDTAYVANRGNNAILIFANGSLASGIPTATITGAHTELDQPTGVYVR